MLRDRGEKDIYRDNLILSSLRYRITNLLQYDVQFMGIWDTPLPSFWLPYLSTFVNS